MNFNISLENILVVTMTLFAVINMMGNIPLVIKLRNENGHIESGKSSLIATFIMILALIVGETIFSLLGIDVSHFAIAGSVLLTYFGVKMILGISSNDNTSEISKATVFPIAFPLIAGPGTLATIISFKSTFTIPEISIGIVINSLVVFFILKSATYIERILGKNGIVLMERFFGIILISIAIKIFLKNLIIALNSISI
jgi:multiple antibiotic resistance protein